MTRGQDGVRARVRGPGRLVGRGRGPARVRTRCWPRRSTSWTGGSGTTTPGWSSRSGTRPGPTLDGYRGVNANMHTVEALLAVGDLRARGADRDPGRARLRARERLADPRALRRRRGRRSPTTTGPSRRTRSGRTAPPSATGSSGAGSRSGCATRSAPPLPTWMLDDARALFDAGVREGWAVDGADGFVYTVDWDGTPVVRQRMHWVVTEALAAAATLHAVTGEASYAAWQRAVVGLRRRVPRRPRARLVAPRARPGEPPGGGHLGREAGRLPRVPGDPGAAAAGRRRRSPGRSTAGQLRSN